jgi:acyl-CoA synthetase (AMP-forming)/AMP-acid ligase II
MRIAADMLVHHFLEHSASRYPDKHAAWHKDGWLAYGQLETRANQLANYLISSGIHRGDRVAILLENSFEYIVAFFGALKAGAVTVPLNTDTTTDSLIYYLNHSEARAIVTNKRFSGRLAPAAEKTPSLKLIVDDHDNPSAYEAVVHCHHAHLQQIYGMPDHHPGIRIIDIDLASIVYTSGSTGKPKGVMLTHLNLVSNTQSIVEYLKLTPNDRVMVVLPFFYIYGKSLLTTHFLVGGSLVIDNRFAFPKVVLETMQNTEVTGFSGVPSTFLILLNKSPVRKYKFDSLRYVTQAGGAMAPSIQKEVAEAFAPAELFIMYGATEAAPRLSYLEPSRLMEKCGSIGKAIPNVELLVADENHHSLPPNQTGEIVARGSNIMAGYWKDPDGTSEVLRNGYYSTGDLGRSDEDGYLYVVGRSKDIIKTGGFRVSAKEVEEALLEIDEIHETAVIAVADETLGEAIKAFIVPREHLDSPEETIRKKLKDKLPTFKLPKFVEILESLPKNESGKVLKTVLKEKEARVEARAK